MYNAINNDTMADICCIGHITLDKVITPKFTAHMPGGTAYYFAKALKNFNHAGFKLVTSLGESEMSTVDELRGEGIDVEVIPSRRTVYFENKYGENTDDRTQRVLAKADPFTNEKLQNIKARIFHLGTLTADDFSLDVIKELSGRGLVSVDVQGYLRRINGEQVVPVDYEEKREAMKYISILKANEMEMEVLTDTADPQEAARILASWGCPEVILTLGEKGSLIYSENIFYQIDAFPSQEIVDATGCGDTYMAGYLYKRSQGASIPEAGKFAAAMCTIKLGTKGPCNATLADIETVIAESTTSDVEYMRV